jgi:hypothetical protein
VPSGLGHRRGTRRPWKCYSSAFSDLCNHRSTSGALGSISSDLADGVIGAMPVNHGKAEAVPFISDGRQETDEQVVISERSVADMGSDLEADTGQRGADGEPCK